MSTEPSKQRRAGHTRAIFAQRSDKVNHVATLGAKLFLTPMHTQTYRFSPLTVQVQSATLAQHQQLAACWQQLFRIAPADPNLPAMTVTDGAGTRDGATIGVTLWPAPRQAKMPPLSANALVASFGHVQIWQTDQGWHYTCGRTHLQIEAGLAQAVGYLAADFGNYLLAEQRGFWQSIFFVLARRAGCYFLHANALCPPPATRASAGPAPGVLFVGDCGAGKTTVSLSLIKAGWRYVSDDSVMLQMVDAGAATPSRKGPHLVPYREIDLAPSGKVGAIAAHAVRRGFACTQQTAARWPWLAALLAGGPLLDGRKTLIDLDRLDPTSFVPCCRPRLLLFPRISGAAQSQVTPLTPAQSFSALLGQPHNGLLMEPTLTPALLTLFQALVAQTCGYQLDLGWDVFTEPAQVSTLLLCALSTPTPEAPAI